MTYGITTALGITIGILGIAGWVMNVIAVFGLALNGSVGDNTAMVMLRVAGIFLAPVGAVIGWF